MLAFGRTLIYVVEIEIEIENVIRAGGSNDCAFRRALPAGTLYISSHRPTWLM